MLIVAGALTIDFGDPEYKVRHRPARQAVEFVVTAQQLYDERRADADSYNAKYIGEPIRVTGRVTLIRGVHLVDGDYVTLGVDNDTTGVYGIALQDFSEREIASLNKGDEIVADCRVASFIMTKIYLRDCSLETLPTDWARVSEVTVGPELVDCVGVAPMRCMVVDGMFFYEPIDGFEHQPGYTYHLRIEEYDAWPGLEEPPQDASKYGYRLIQVLSKTNDR